MLTKIEYVLVVLMLSIAVASLLGAINSDMAQTLLTLASFFFSLIYGLNRRAAVRKTLQKLKQDS